MKKDKMGIMDWEELRSLYYLGFTLHWLKPKDKMPVHAGWTKNPRPSWQEFQRQYFPDFNVGVRLGRVSKVYGKNLAVIDLDIKSESIEDEREALKKLFELFPEAKKAPKVLSGRGNGSAHFYVLTDEPISGGDKRAQSPKQVRVLIKNARASKREIEELSPQEIAEGFRIRAAWEISLLSEGRQVVLPPSIHPDTGRQYEWAVGASVLERKLPLIPSERAKSGALSLPSAPKDIPKTKRVYRDINPDTLGLSEEHVEWIKTGLGVFDRSAAAFSIAMALVRREVSDEDIISLLTDKSFFLGQMAYDHRPGGRDQAAYWIEKYTLQKAKQKVKESAFDHEVVEEKSPSLEVSKSWKSELDWQSGVKGAPPILRSTFKNLRLIIQNEISFSLLKRNLFSNEDIYDCETPWGYHRGRKRSGNTEDALHVKQWAIETFGLEASISLIDEALNSIALQNSFHPVKDFLEDLEWDGIERIPTAFKVYLNAEMKEPYLSTITKKWFQALIARIYEPGIKFDFLPVFEGKQGIGKSSFGSLLVGHKWFLDGLPDLTDKDSALNLQGIWLCEMAELAAIYRTQIEITKSFLTRTVDKLRPPYGHRRADFPRQNIFYGTTNSRDYLTDATGNRRYWPVMVHGLNFSALKRDRLQLLAEAKFRYDHFSEKLYLTGKSLIQAEEYQENRRISDESDSMQIRFIEWSETDMEETWNINELNMEDLFDKGPWNRFSDTMSTRKYGAMVLRNLGYEKHHTKRGKRWVRAFPE